MYAKIRLKTGRVFWATAKSLEGSTLILRVVNKTGDWGVTKGNKIIDEYAVAASDISINVAALDQFVRWFTDAEFVFHVWFSERHVGFVERPRLVHI